MTAAEDRGGQHHGHSHSQHSTARGPSRGLFFGMLAFVGIAVYVLIVTHHLKIDMHGLHLQSHGRSSGGTSGPAELMKRAAVDPAAAAHFTKRMISIGAYSRYDADKNGQLSQAEFEVFLNDLAKSNILDPMALNSDHGTAADLVIRQQTVSAVNAATGTGGKQNKQAAKTDGVVVSEPQTTGQACPELSKELVASFAKDNTIILTVSDWRIFQNFVVAAALDQMAGVNWMKHLKRLGVENYLVGATDKKTAAFLGSQGRHPCFKFFEEGPDHSDKEYKYGSEHYVAATWRKVTVVQQIVGWGFNVLHSDVDVVWFRDPLPYMLGPALKDVDMAVSTDLVSTGNSKRDEGLEVSVHQHVNVNTGVYFVKSTPGGQAFMLAWAGLRKTLIHDNDQTGLYQWIRGQPAEVDGQKRFVQLHVSTTRSQAMTTVAVLHPSLPSSGHFSKTRIIVDGLHCRQALQVNDMHCIPAVWLLLLVVLPQAGETPFRLGLLSVSMLLNGYSYFIPKLNVYQNVSALVSAMSHEPCATIHETEAWCVPRAMSHVITCTIFAFATGSAGSSIHDGIHLTWVPLSREGKFHRMRDGMLYNDEPEYYSGPQFITADIDFPPVPPGYNEMRDTEAMIKIHLAKMEVQLKQMYRAMAIAVIMNRTLVLPKLQCFCYKNWFMMEQCRQVAGQWRHGRHKPLVQLQPWLTRAMIPGDRATVYPMECQLDQWLRPKVIYNYGPNIVGKDGPQTFMFREHTMFENPNFPKKDLESEVVVEPADVPTAKVDTSSPKTKVLVPQEGLKQTALKSLLEGLGPTAKIIRIRHPSQVFAGWDDDKLKTSFEVRHVPQPHQQAATQLAIGPEGSSLAAVRGVVGQGAFLDKVAGNWCCRDKPFIAEGLKEKEKLAISWSFRVHHSTRKQLFPTAAAAPLEQHLLIALLPNMPPVPKHTRASRANGAKTQAGHEAAKSMEQLTAAHAALTAAHAAVTADLLSSQQLYSQLRERHCSLMVFAGQRDQQWELDLLGWVQQVEQLEEAFLQQLQATQAQLTDTAAALEAAQKDLAAARTELAHTKQQLTTTNIKLEQLRAQVDAANKGFSKDHKDKWNLLMRSRVSLPFLRGMLSSQGTKPTTQPACHPATQSSSLARPRNQECDTHTGGYTAEYILSRERLLSLPGVSAEQLGTLCTAVVGAVFPGADPGRQASATTHRRNHDLLQTYIHEAHTVWLRRAFAVHVQLDGCTIPTHGKVVLYRVTAAVRCFSPSPAAAAGSPSPALAPSPASAPPQPCPNPVPALPQPCPSPAPAAAAGSPSPAPAPMPTARTPEVQEMPSPTPQLEVKARVVAVRKCPDSSSYPALQQFVDVCRKQGVWRSLASITAHTAAGSLLTAAASAPNPLALEGPQQWAAAKPKLVVLINKHIQALYEYLYEHSQLFFQLPHLLAAMGSSNALYAQKAAEQVLKQGLDAMIDSINNKLDPGALANIDLADFEARLLTLRKQKRDKETTSADDNREAKAARKAEESACMVDGNAKMVLNVPTQAPLQQLQQAFQQHARGADYSNTSAKEATRFTREQLRAYLLYHKVPPRDQPVGNTLVAGWQKAVQKHIAERGSPTGHGVLP
ncbi:hypothetical protein QJQ45_029767 [Haematococcus lacustris]|nr:hypothetical protein QJQ45_029767 [Haematococcus lacustris]